jgi:predicted ester cyclase
MIGIGLTGFQVVYAQVLDRDVEAPTSGLNGTAGAPPNVSIDISPLEELPINGTVTMSLEDVADTNMNEIPPPGVTVIISNEAVTVTNHPLTGNVGNVSDFISEQYFNRESQVDPVRGQLRGPAEFIDTVENLRTAFPDLRHLEETIIAQDDEVVSVINVTGTHTGNFFILPPTGNEISYEAVHLYRVGQDGKIVEHKAIRDDLTFLAQLGVIEPSKPEYAPFFQVLTGTTANSTG